MKHIYLLLSLFLSSIGFFINGQSYITGSVYGGTSITTVYDNFLDNSQNLYSLGLYNVNFDFGGETYALGGGNSDAYVVKHDADGNELYALTFTGNSDNSCVAGDVDSDGNVYITGFFKGAGVNAFDADPSENEFLLENDGVLLTRDCFVIKLDADGNFIWAKKFSNSFGGSNEDSQDLIVDDSGNVFIVGRFASADFDPDENSEYVLTTTSGSFEGFVVKLDTDGNFQWAQHFKDAANRVNSITLDDSGNPWVMGEFEGTVSISDDTNSYSLTPVAQTDVYIASFDTNNGNVLSAESFGGDGNVYVDKIIKTQQGIAYAGNFQNTAKLDPSGGVSYTSSGGLDAYIVQYDTANDTYEHYILPSSGSFINSISDLHQDETNNILVSGEFQGSVDFDYSDSDMIYTATGQESGFVLNLGTNFSFEDAFMYMSTNKAKSIQIETAGNDLYINGYFDQTIDLDPFDGVDEYTHGGTYKGFLSIVTYQNLGVEDVTHRDQVKIYPNPVQDAIFFTNTEIKEYQIYSANGSLVQSGMFDNTPISVAQLNTGSYIIKFKLEDQWISHTFIKK